MCSREGWQVGRWSAAGLFLVLAHRSSRGVLAFTQCSVPFLPSCCSSRNSVSEAVASSYRFSVRSPNGGSAEIQRTILLRSTFSNIPPIDSDGEPDDEEEDDEVEQDPYLQAAASEFSDENATDATSSLAPVGVTSTDWGAAHSALRSRISDVESGKSTSPSNALFRIMSVETPNEAIGNFVSEASAEVVQAMSGAVSSLLGGLSNPAIGVETIVKTSGEKIGSLCFQLQMTGYMFRNAEYVLALKGLMKIGGSATVDEFRDAFERMDVDGSGYIEAEEIETLLADVYEGKPPSFEVETFLNFFDSNNDGRISWEEFEKGLGVMSAKKAAGAVAGSIGSRRLNGRSELKEEDDDTDDMFPEPTISGKVEVELKSGKVIEVEAMEYINDLKKEAEALKEELRREKGGSAMDSGGPAGLLQGVSSPNSSEGIAGYIASLQGDVKSLTEGISPEVVEAMKMLVDFVLDGGTNQMGRRNNPNKDKDLEMEIPGAALQQLALWQLVLGYRLREAEATGEYRKMLDT